MSTLLTLPPQPPAPPSSTTIENSFALFSSRLAAAAFSACKSFNSCASTLRFSSNFATISASGFSFFARYYRYKLLFSLFLASRSVIVSVFSFFSTLGPGGAFLYFILR